MPNHTPDMPAHNTESDISAETPFSLIWLNALDPRTFTPYTWKNGRETTIRLRGGNGGKRISVQRIVSRYTDGKTELIDEVYSADHGESGSHEVTRFKYTFNDEDELTGYDPTPTLTEHGQSMVDTMSSLVAIPGSKIEADNYRIGRESSFISDGTQWIDPDTHLPIASQQAITMGQLELDPPQTE